MNFVIKHCKNYKSNNSYYNVSSIFIIIEMEGRKGKWQRPDKIVWRGLAGTNQPYLSVCTCNKLHNSRRLFYILTKMSSAVSKCKRN